MEEQLQTVEPVPPQQVDMAQLAPIFAPLVFEYQRGEIEKAKLGFEAQIKVAELRTNRQMGLDKSLAAGEERQDKFELATTCLLFTGCASMMIFGMVTHDNGFITAGVTSFASFLAGKHSRGAKAKKEHAE